MPVFVVGFRVFATENKLKIKETLFKSVGQRAQFYFYLWGPFNYYISTSEQVDTTITPDYRFIRDN